MAVPLLSRRLLMFSGKGGVGKSTITAAWAIAAARRGKRVLVVEFGEHERISRIFGAAAVGYRGGIVYHAPGVPPVSAMCITAVEALREYGMRSVKFEVIYNAVFDNPVVRYFAAAAPGLEDLNLLGKLESLHRESTAPTARAPYDLILLDAPATGHAFAFFQAPQTAMRLAQVGPIYSSIERMWKLITDPARTALNIIALPEEMPVNEAIEFDVATAALGIPRGLLIVNGMFPNAFPEGMDALAAVRVSTPLAQRIVDAARSTIRQRAEQESLVAKLTAAIPAAAMLLPLVVAPALGRKDLEYLAERIGASIDHV